MDATLVRSPEISVPSLRASARTHSLAGIETELARIWAATELTTAGVDGEPERRIAARTSVLNLVVIARQRELGEHAAAVIRNLTGRHPSRTLIVSSADPDGPSWIDATVQAHCVLPRPDAAETCAEFIDLVAGGETGRHVAAIVAPLLIHDLPVTLWWPGDPPLASRQALDLLDMADRLVVDGSHWSGNGIDRLHALARLVDDHEGAGDGLAVSDFAMLRQSRWREAIASSFDRPELRPFLRSLTDITVTYAVHAATRRGEANVIKPLYHVAWLASRLGMSVAEPLEHLKADGGSSTSTAPTPDAPLEPPRVGALRAARRRVTVTLRPVESPAPRGTTLTVELTARRRATPLSIVVSAEADAVMVRARLDGRPLPERRFMAPRRTEVDLLVEAVESVGRDSIAVAALLMAAELIGES